MDFDERKTRKAQAYAFLASLEEDLTSQTPVPLTMRRIVRDTVANAKTNSQQKHMRQPENAFLYKYAVPILFKRMQGVDGITQDHAAKALLSEFYRHTQEYCKETPAVHGSGAFPAVLLSGGGRRIRRSSSSGAFTFGGGADVRITRHFSLRAEVRDLVTAKGLSGSAGRHHVLPVFGVAFHR